MFYPNRRTNHLLAIAQSINTFEMMSYDGPDTITMTQRVHDEILEEVEDWFGQSHGRKILTLYGCNVIIDELANPIMIERRGVPSWQFDASDVLRDNGNWW